MREYKIVIALETPGPGRKFYTPKHVTEVAEQIIHGFILMSVLDMWHEKIKSAVVLYIVATEGMHSQIMDCAFALKKALKQEAVLVSWVEANIAFV